MSPSEAELALNAASVWIGPERFHGLMERFGSAEAALKAGEARICGAVPNFSLEQARAFIKYCGAFDASAEARALERSGARALRWDSPEYPSRLRELPKPAPWLFVKGALPPEGAPAVAVVGTRTPTPYGRRMARSLAEGLAKAGVWVVSGLARGIDAEAHESCVAAGGSTVAVLGTGLDNVWPPENGPLSRRILEKGGGLVSQFSMAAPGHPKHFPMRNGVISALSMGVVVVEGARASGALITANWALDQGREVFAVPGPADAPQSQGPLDLLEKGARLVRGPGDILEELGLGPKRRPRRALVPGAADAMGDGSAPGEASPALRLWRGLNRAGPVSLEAAASMSGLAASELAAAVTELELRGALRRIPGGRIESKGM